MFHLTPGQPVADGVRAVAVDELAVAVAAIDRGDLHEAVHEARRRTKKVRALLRLVRDGVPRTYRRVNDGLRDTARLVAREREATAALETHDALVRALGEETRLPYAPVRDALVARREDAAEAEVAEQLPTVRARLVAARDDAAGWALPEGDAVEVLRAGYARTYGRARARWSEAVTDPSTHLWHQWRKRVKYHRHHVELLQLAWPPVMVQREGLLHDLTNLLGEDHDLADLRAALLRGDLADLDGELLSGYVGLLDARRTLLRRTALPLAARLFAAPVEHHADLVLAWWRRSVEEAAAAGPDGDAVGGTPSIAPHEG